MIEGHGSLAAVFMAHLKEAQQWKAPPDLETSLQALVARGRVAWPQWPVAAGDLVCHVARNWDEDVKMPLTKVFSEDVHLVLACLGGIPGAIAEVDGLLSRGLRQLAIPKPTDEFIREVMQTTRCKLLAGTVGGQPYLVRYGGRAPLVRWINVVARNVAFDLRKAGSKEVPLVEDALAQAAEIEPMPNDQFHPEKAYLIRRYGSLISTIFRSAFVALSERHQRVLRLKYSGKLSGMEIAAKHGVDKATANRWVKEAAAHLKAECTRQARVQAQFTASEFESLLHSLQSRIELSLLIEGISKPTNEE